MTSVQIPGSVFPDSKKHYAILDGLRGVAAVMVVAFHVLETHSTSHQDQIINHGYLAVDFFYVLSGFVIGYAARLHFIFRPVPFGLRSAIHLFGKCCWSC